MDYFTVLLVMALAVVIVGLLLKMRLSERQDDEQAYKSTTKYTENFDHIDHSLDISSASGSTSLEEEVRKHLSNSRKIQAIKLVRDEKGLGLKEAVAFVDRIENQGYRQ